ncbi:MAG: alanyl-tRNA editing protein [Candidatus Aenigmarchaeota archaeon]|nr:alanyl-tRNA editing protein [Candidatus Aenigmarchaeota archaeon]
MRPLYLQDHGLREFDATVVSVNGLHVILDNTAFYPSSGGQPNDTGVLVADGVTYTVTNVTKTGGSIVHELDAAGLHAGDRVHGVIDWQRRHALSRMHTAAHVLSAIIHKEAGALITGNQLGIDQSRIDFSLDVLDRETIASYVEKANKALASRIPVKTYFLRREEALHIPGVVKLAAALPPNVSELHIVEIGSVDTQADAGTHVSNTDEVGRIELLRMENKGKSNRRVYFALRQP